MRPLREFPFGMASTALKIGFVKTATRSIFNRRHQVVGHLFQGRFKSTVIEAEKYLLEVSRYFHLNPVRGVVMGQGTPIERRARLREYRWSSYRGYAGVGEKGIIPGQ